MVIDRFGEIPFADLVEKVATGIIDGQLALDLNGITTEKYLSDIKLPAKSVIIAIVETIDQHGNITGIETLLNEQPISLSDLGLSPMFPQFSEVSVLFEFVAYLRHREANMNQQEGNIQKVGIGLYNSQNSYDKINRLDPFLELFKHPKNILNYYGKQNSDRDFSLAVSSATSIAVSSKVKGEWGVWRIKAMIRPKNSPFSAIAEDQQETVKTRENIK